MIVNRPRRMRRRLPSGARPFSLGALAGVPAGMLAAYFLEPGQGRRRRRLVRARTGAALRRQPRSASRAARVAASVAVGRAHGLAHRLRPPAPRPLDDAELAHKVESILFRDSAVPKGDLNINAERGTVFLRGQVESSELIRELEERVRAIVGVQEVENLLHLPGEPAQATHGLPKAPGAPARE